MKNLLRSLDRKDTFTSFKGTRNHQQMMDYEPEVLNQIYIEIEETLPRSKGVLGISRQNSVIKRKLKVIESMINYKMELREKNTELTAINRRKETLLHAANVKEVQELVSGKSAKQLRKEAGKL